MHAIRIMANLRVADIDAAKPWGVHRFFVRAPDGNVFNIVRHHS